MRDISRTADAPAAVPPDRCVAGRFSTEDASLQSVDIGGIMMATEQVRAPLVEQVYANRWSKEYRGHGAPLRDAGATAQQTCAVTVPARRLKTVAVLFAAALSLLANTAGRAAGTTDFLDIGDAGDNTIKRFDATTGSFLGIFGGTIGNILRGPRGLVIDPTQDLLVSDQNVNTSKDGAILQYSPLGDRERALVPISDKNAPAVPRGIVLLNNFLYVANFSTTSQRNKPVAPGQLLQFRSDGVFVGAFTPPAGVLPANTEFHPRALVAGPDGMLYVSNFPNPNTSGLGGQVLRFNPATAQFDPQPFITSSGGDTCDCVNELNRPEGLVFGPAPDFKLYITSFQADPTDTDKIVIFQGPKSAAAADYVSRIDLDDGALQPRAFAQALLFGPQNALFVPISGNGPDQGAVRRYDVSALPASFTDFVPAHESSGPLVSPWYLTFGKTDPATLAYPSAATTGPDHVVCICKDNTALNFCATLDCSQSAQQDAICGPACAAHGGEAATGCALDGTCS
jgi:hypothetical protein